MTKTEKARIEQAITYLMGNDFDLGINILLSLLGHKPLIDYRNGKAIPVFGAGKNEQQFEYKQEGIVKTKEQARIMQEKIRDSIIELSPGTDDLEINQLYRWSRQLMRFIEYGFIPEAGEVRLWLEGNEKCTIAMEYEGINQWTNPITIPPPSIAQSGPVSPG